MQREAVRGRHENARDAPVQMGSCGETQSSARPLVCFAERHG